ncbi:MAG: ribosomal protein S12 methylthiotransferase RimO [Phycisphaerae bacterium]|nr:MAG: 30S ribosomal protein S12 methylthiotransferase RimO [Planctomycetia bacterium]GJQ26190.1 MAG: ribosomal protein S12 methylthiotransferase RimO [Phycisphaerae bacterium]
MSAPSVSFVSLGCPKNLVDSEKMLGLLAEAGCPIVSPDDRADVVVVNTCGFLSASREEAVGILRELADQKRAGELKRIVVAGCLVQRDGQGLVEAVPEIDALVGVNNRQDVVRAVLGGKPKHGAGSKAKAKAGAKSKSTAKSSSRSLPVVQPDTMPDLYLGDYHAASWTEQNRSDRARLRLTPTHYAYLRMSEGCNQKCTFCTIPSIRGPMHCKTPDEIMAEARELIDDGALELNLIGQDTTSYGQDIGYEPGLSGLLRTLNTLDGVRWIRLMYAYPSDFTDEMIDAIAQSEKIAPYIDIPLQHINDRVLKAMHRRVTRAQTETLLAKLRERIPGVAIRTTFIAGFPGETHAEFQELQRFIAEFGFEAVGVFPYSSEPGTPAHKMKGSIDPDIIEERVGALMQTQQEVAFRRNAAMKGREMLVMIDDFGRMEGPGCISVYPARHAGQAPEVDSVTLVQGGEYDPGEVVRVRITGHRDYDLLAAPVTIGLPVLHG